MVSEKSLARYAENSEHAERKMDIDVFDRYFHSSFLIELGIFIDYKYKYYVANFLFSSFFSLFFLCLDWSACGYFCSLCLTCVIFYIDGH